jgi:uncharacterized membrane protein
VIAYLFTIYLFFKKLKEKFSPLKVKIFIYFLAPLSAFGIYLGRTKEFLNNGEHRLNS